MTAPNNPSLNSTITDTLTEVPIHFTVDDRRFYIRPFSLGKWLIAQRIINGMNLDPKGDLTAQIYRLCADPKTSPKAARLIAVATYYRHSELTNPMRIAARTKWLDERLTAEEKTQLIVLFLSSDNTAMLKDELGMTADAKNKARLSALRKNSGDSVSFGGKSVWGTVVDFACERYGWTLQYVIWGISYANLILMTSDILTTSMIDKDERRKLHIISGDTLSADDPNNRDKILALMTQK